MNVALVVLLDRGTGLAPTLRGLEGLVGTEPEIHLVVRCPGQGLAERCEEIRERHPSWQLWRSGSHDRAAVVARVLNESTADAVVVLGVGTQLLPQSLTRMLAAAGDLQGSVAGRSSGTPPWDTTLAQEAPVPLLLASRARALTATASIPDVDALPADAWVEAWQRAVLDDGPVQLLDDYPVVRGRRLPTPERLDPLVSTADLSDDALVLSIACASAPSTGQPPLAAWRLIVIEAVTGEELAVPSRPSGHEGWRDVVGRLDLGSLPDGVWRPSVEMVDATAHGRGWFRIQELPDLLVHGRPVVTTRQGDYLELQLGRLRRSVVRLDAGARPRTEAGPAGVLVRLPVPGLVGVGSRPAIGRATWDGQELVARLVPIEGAVELELEVPHDGCGPLLVQFGTADPVATGVILRVADALVTLDAERSGPLEGSSGSVASGTSATRRARALAGRVRRKLRALRHAARN